MVDAKTSLFFSSDALVVMSCAILAINIALLLWSIFRSNCFGILRKIVRNMCIVPKATRKLDATQIRVQQELTSRRVARAKTVVSVVFCVAPLFLLSYIISYVSKRQGGRPITDVIFLIACALATLLGTCPYLLRSQTLDAWYFVLVVLIGLLVSPITMSAEDLRGYSNDALVAMFFMALFNLRLNSVVASTVLVTLVEIYTFMIGDMQCIEIFRQRLVIDCVKMGIVFIVLIAVVDRCIVTMVRNEIETEADRSMLSAVRAVLKTVCDVVVELDVKLRLKDHAPQLADLLLISPLQSLKATALSSFIPAEEDRLEFERRIHASLGNQVGMADVFHTHMRDASSSSISMEIFSVPVLGPDRQISAYILGMREFTDVPPVVVDTADRPSSDTFVVACKNKETRAFPAGPAPCVLGGDMTPTVHAARLHGTPPQLERSELRSALELSGPKISETGSSGAKSSSSDSTFPAASGSSTRIPTTMNAKRITLMVTIRHWRSESQLCCPMHESLQEAMQIAQSLEHAPCNPNFHKGIDWQCRRCGIMDPQFKRSIHAKHCLLCKEIQVSKLAKTKRNFVIEL